MLNKISYLVLKGIVLFVVLIDTAFAYIPTSPIEFGGIPEIGGIGTSREDIDAGVAVVISNVLSYMALLATVMIIIAGIRLVVSGANEEAREVSKKMIYWTLIGLIILLFARAIVGVAIYIAGNT